MQISLAERKRLLKQNEKIVDDMVRDNSASYQYGKKTMGQYLKDKKFIKKYNTIMEEFLDI